MSSFGNELNATKVKSNKITAKDSVIIGGYNDDTGDDDKFLHMFPTDQNFFISDVRFFGLPESSDGENFQVGGKTRQLQGGQVYRDASNVLKIKS